MTGTFTQDLHFALRQFLKRPGFTAMAVLILALGLGANTAIFSVVNAFLLRPLPFKQPDRLVAVFERNVLDNNEPPYNPVAPGNFLDWQKLSTTFEQISACDNFSNPLPVNLASPSSSFVPERIDGSACSSNLFGTLGVAPLLGRTFRPDEDRYGAPKVAVISFNLWQRRFGGDRNVIGKQIRLDGENHEIVGVMPSSFSFPFRTVEVWIPLLTTIPPERQVRHDTHFLGVIARLRRGVSLQQARAEIDGIAARYKRAHPEEITGRGGNVVLLRDSLVLNVRTSLLVLLGAVACVLLIACVNIANLLLTRAAGRSREISIRAAIGASRGRIVRQLLTESILLALAGGTLGGMLAFFIAEILVAHAPGADSILPPGAIPLDPIVLLFTFGVALITGAVAGLFPAVQCSRTDVVAGLKDSSRSATAGRSQGRFRNLLVAAELALSLVLLIAAGLLLRSFSQLYKVNPGVRVEHTLTMAVSLPNVRYKGPAQRSAFFREVGDRMQSVPGVLSAGLVSCAPVDGHCDDHAFYIEGHPLPPGQAMDALDRGADPRYFAAAGIPLLRGRTFTEKDGIGFDEQHPKMGAVVISASMAKTYFPHQDPIGQRIFFGVDVEKQRRQGTPVPRYEVIGVVGDTITGLDQRAEPTVYVPLLDGHYDEIYVLMHTAGEPDSVIAAARHEIQKLNPDLAVYETRTMEEIIGRSASDRQFSMLLFGSFAALALLLAAVGLYAVLAYAVAQRRSEIGIRMALGADHADVSTLVLKEGMKPAIAGIAAGLLGAFFATQILKSLLFGTAPTDPLTFCVVPFLLLAVAALACYIPAARAARIDPTVALRTE